MNNDKIIIDKHYYYENKNLRDRIWLNIDEKNKIVKIGYVYLENECYEDMSEEEYNKLWDKRRSGEYKEVYINSFRYQTPYERRRQQAYGSGNKWVIENFNATH